MCSKNQQSKFNKLAEKYHGLVQTSRSMLESVFLLHRLSLSNLLLLFSVAVVSNRSFITPSTLLFKKF